MGKIDKQRRSREPLRPAAKERAATEDRRRRWRRHAWRLLAIWGLVLIAYSNSLQSGLVFDNSSVIGRDPRIRQATSQNIEAILTGGYRFTNPTDGLYRPLTTFSFLLNYAVLGNGSRPAGYHWVNLAIHAVNVALVYALGIAILGETAPAWALAALWGLHPLLTESVTNIVGRADLLAAFGVLAGFLCHVRSASEMGRRKLPWLAGVAASQAIGLFSKESAVVLPAIMLLYDLMWFDRAAWRRRAPAYGVLALPFAAYFYLRGQFHLHMVVAFTENPLVHAGFWTARMTAVKVVGKLAMAVLLAGPVIGGLFLQCGTAIRLAGVELGRCQSAHRPGGLSGRRVSGLASGDPLAPGWQGDALLPRFLFHRCVAHFESHRPDRQYHGRAVSLSAFGRPRWILVAATFALDRRLQLPRPATARVAGPPGNRVPGAGRANLRPQLRLEG